MIELINKYNRQLWQINGSCTDLEAKQDDCAKTQPAVETVKVRPRRTREVVRVKDGLETDGRKDEGKHVQWSVKNLHVDLSVVAEHSVH